MILTGVLINAAAVAAGGVLGTLGGRLMPEKMRQTVLGATALVSMGIGISGAIGSSNQLIPILSLVIGAVIGELLHIEDGVTRAGDWLQKKFGKMGPITDGFVSGSLVFAVGAMAVMGSLDSGLKNDHGILLAKSVIDFAGFRGLCQLHGHWHRLFRIVGAGGGRCDDAAGLPADRGADRRGHHRDLRHRVTDDHRHHPERAGRHQAAYPEHDAGAAAARSAVQIHVSALIKRST